MNYATLSSEKNYTIFKFNHYVIRFKAAYSLEYYSSVKEWNHGYLVVMAKYCHNIEDEEEYIDLIPILENLYIDADYFVNQIEEVRVHYDRH